MVYYVVVNLNTHLFLSVVGDRVGIDNAFKFQDADIAKAACADGDAVFAVQREWVLKERVA